MDGLRLKLKMVCASLGLGPSRRMLKLMLACCKVYVSETRNRTALDSIERAAKLFPEAAIVNKFEDRAYNRVGYTLVSALASEPSESCALKSAVLAMVKAVFEPSTSSCTMEAIPGLAWWITFAFTPWLVLLWNKPLELPSRWQWMLALVFKPAVPTYLYGAANEEGQTLDSIRRELGYFKPNSTGNQWAGGPQSDSLPITPQSGPSLATRAKGVVIIGASQWIVNYNVPVYSTDMASVRRIAKRVSGRGGGLQSVQAMALVHGDGVIEVACNLLEPSKVGADQVQAEIERIAGEEGLGAGKGYFTDLTQEKIIESYLKIEKHCE